MPTVEQLQELLEKEPDDPFLNFGLSMALISAGETEAALESFDRTLGLDPQYVPAHFQKGRLLADVGRMDEARETLRKGIEVARAVGDQHAEGEMNEFLSLMEE